MRHRFGTPDVLAMGPACAPASALMKRLGPHLAMPGSLGTRAGASLHGPAHAGPTNPSALQDQRRNSGKHNAVHSAGHDVGELDFMQGLAGQDEQTAATAPYGVGGDRLALGRAQSERAMAR